ncbi:MAG: BamA/TamA family outer membrane protein [Bacteroidota bacterium]|nr:BamA/TamA family outer membrane protein [Bacteroidota bacterium]
MKTFLKNITLVIMLALLAAGCNISKHLTDKQYLLVRNKVKFEDKPGELDVEELKVLIRQKPNTSLLGIARVKMWIYLWTDHEDRSNFSKWINEKLGEKPVVYDKQMADASQSQIQRYLNNVGYFSSKVEFNRKFKNKRENKVLVDYNIDLKRPYRINNVEHDITDQDLRFYVLYNKEKSLLKEGKIYNAYTLEEERNRISNLLKNNGYYEFNKEYIFFEVDSTIGNHKLDIIINISNVKIQEKYSDTAEYVDHQKYYINEIFVNTGYNPLAQKSIPYDTTSVSIQGKNNDSVPYNFIYQDRMKIRPQAVTQSIFIEPGRFFILNDVQRTYHRLNDIRLFKYAHIQFSQVPDRDSMPGMRKYLNCNIQLSMAKRQSYTVEAEGTNTGGNLGVGGNLTYQNKNIFRGAEILSVRLSGSIEVQKLSSVENETQDKTFLFFNTLETGAEVRLYFPRFLVPVRQTVFPKYFKPKTTITTGINYQRRPKYDRYITSLSFGYDWTESSTSKHILFPLDINLVKVLPTPAFDSILNTLEDQRLKNQFTDHLILAAKYSFIYNNQQISKVKNFLYFRGNLETSGNIMKLTDQLLNAPKNENGNYTLFGIRYAQYFRTDIDLRYYFVLSEESRIATRLLMGIGIPYGNSDAIPFEKGFYGGGANGMRAWKFRSLGPGSYINADTDFDRMGDMKLEINAEYRFPIYSFFKGAFFVDAGNVWLLNQDPSFPGGEFQFSNFAREIAIGGGFGLRMDFGFFVFRIDGAVPFRNPAQPTGERWVFDKAGFNRVNWNFGIGYPF